MFYSVALLRIVALEIASLAALRGCSKKAREEPGYIGVFAEKTNKNMVKHQGAQSLSYVQLLWTHGLQPARLPCPIPTPGACSNSCPSSQWCHPTISSSVFLSPLLSVFPSIRVFSSASVLNIRWPKYYGVSASASVLPTNVQDLFPVGLTGLISQSKGLSRVFSNTTAQKHQFFSAHIQLYT